MTQDEIIEMAKEAGFPIFGTKVVATDPMQQIMADVVTQHYHDSAIHFAKLVAEREREACAKIADEYANGLERNYSEIIAEAIRARGQA